jgi:hypothetical protein
VGKEECTGNHAKGVSKYLVARNVKTASETPDKRVLLPEYSLILLLANPPNTGNPGKSAKLAPPALHGGGGGGRVQTTPFTAPRATSSRFGFETSLSAVERYWTAAMDSKKPRMATTKADEMMGRIVNFPERRAVREIGKRIWKDPDSTWPRTLTPA